VKLWYTGLEIPTIARLAANEVVTSAAASAVAPHAVGTD